MSRAWPVTIDGRDYAVDLRGVQLTSIEKIRQQADPSREFGEASLNPLDLWRRTQDDWSAGAGQEYLDKRESSVRRRFLSGEHIDPWTRGDLTLSFAAVHYADLVDVVGLSAADGNIAYVFNDAGDWSINTAAQGDITAGSGLFPEEDLYPDASTFPLAASSSFTTLATKSTRVAADVCSDGFYVYVLDDVEISSVDMTTGTISSVAAQTGDFCAFAKGRLLIGDGATLYDASSGTATDMTPSTVNSNWGWVAAAESGQAIYVAGTGGDRSTIFGVTVTQDGASLSAPVPAATLPYGETIKALYGYVDVIVIGTNKGFRIAQADSSGNLYYGPLVDVGNVTSFAAFGKFVHFGGNDTDDLGFVGKINLGEFTDNLVPAWSLDLFTASTDRTLQGAETEVIGDMVAVADTFVWLVENHLWYQATGEYSPTGNVTSGEMTYDLAGDKVFERFQIIMNPLAIGESVVLSVIVDDVETAVTTINTFGSTGGDFDISSTSLAGETIKYKLVLNRGDAETSAPVISRVTLRALPDAGGGDQFQLPLILRERVADLQGNTHTFDPMAEYAALKAIETAGGMVTVNLWGTEYEAVLDGVQFGPELEYTSDQQGLQGTAIVSLRTFDAGE